MFLADLRKIFAGAPCCLLLLSWSLSSKSVLAFACYCLLGHAFAPWSVELILNLNSSWLYCFCFALHWFAWLYLALPCFTLLCLALPYFTHALSVPLLLRFCLMLAHFSLLWLIFFDFLTHLTSSCIFLIIFGELHRFLQVLGRFWEGFWKVLANSGLCWV